jgi:hypothetical protein
MLNYFYRNSIDNFLISSDNEILGSIDFGNNYNTIALQKWAWEEQIPLLKKALAGLKGDIFFEFSIPRMGKRVDALVIIQNVVFVIEFKIGERQYLHSNIDQVWDYALDLKNFHQPSHGALLVPILVATEAISNKTEIEVTSHNDNLLVPILVNSQTLGMAIAKVLKEVIIRYSLDGTAFMNGSYMPTPTIIEAAVSLYHSHTVNEITRNDAANLTKTTSAISDIIEYAKSQKKKVICFVTGVPGAGKTLVGLKVATSHLDKVKGNASVYLSGNGPLVAVLHEALARDKVARDLELGKKATKSKAKQSIKTFIQIIHHYRDEYLRDKSAPYDHVAIFDEAQRAWNKEQTVKFMKRKKNIPDFNYSEPEFLISCLDRHPDWAVIVCLVGGGQEINTGEAGISEWLKAIENTFKYWEVYVSPNLSDSEYAAEETIQRLEREIVVKRDSDLHLSVSMRSFRAENLSLFVKYLLDMDIDNARETLYRIREQYPIVLTRDLEKAKQWLRQKARGSERYGMVVSSQAYRLKPFAIDVKTPTDPVHWFLNDKEDIRSSYFLEDVATEFQIQGLELDWTCLIWDGDLRFSEKGWKPYSFVGTKWNNIKQDERIKYLINAYRVLLTRARQGMVIVVPEGNTDDLTRKPEYYDATYEYLKGIGIKVI